MNFVKPYAKRERVQFTTTGPSMTKQSMQQDCDINNILAKYQKTGLITHVRAGGGYEDLPNDLDYHNSLNIVMEAQASFDALPSTVRREFDNDPARFLSFVADPDNVDRMRELGIVRPAEPTAKKDADVPLAKPEVVAASPSKGGEAAKTSTT